MNEVPAGLTQDAPAFQAGPEAARGAPALPATSWRPSEESSADTALARFILELRSKGLTDPALLNAFERVPRAEFVPGFAPALLYSPVCLPLPCGEEATDPFSLARHLVLLDVRPGLRVLEIGTGSGYLSALLARLGATITSFERYRTLVRRAERVFRATGVASVTPALGDGMARLDRPEGFDRIIVNGAIETMPQHLMDRLHANGVALAHRQRGLETHLVVWKKDLSGYALAQDHGPSRLGLMRAGVPDVL